MPSELVPQQDYPVAPTLPGLFLQGGSTSSSPFGPSVSNPSMLLAWRPSFNRFMLRTAASRNASATFGQYPWSATTTPRFFRFLPLLLTERAKFRTDSFEAVCYLPQGTGDSSGLFSITCRA